MTTPKLPDGAAGATDPVTTPSPAAAATSSTDDAVTTTTPAAAADAPKAEEPKAASTSVTQVTVVEAPESSPKPDKGKEDEKGGGVPSWLATALFAIFLLGLLGGVAWKLWEGRSAPALVPAIAPAPTVTIPSATEWHKGGSEVSEYR